MDQKSSNTPSVHSMALVALASAFFPPNASAQEEPFFRPCHVKSETPASLTMKLQKVIEERTVRVFETPEGFNLDIISVTPGAPGLRLSYYPDTNVVRLQEGGVNSAALSFSELPDFIGCIDRNYIPVLSRSSTAHLIDVQKGHEGNYTTIALVFSQGLKGVPVVFDGSEERYEVFGRFVTGPQVKRLLVTADSLISPKQYLYCNGLYGEKYLVLLAMPKSFDEKQAAFHGVCPSKDWGVFFLELQNDGEVQVAGIISDRELAPVRYQYEGLSKRLFLETLDGAVRLNTSSISAQMSLHLDEDMPSIPRAKSERVASLPQLAPELKLR